ncbi:flavin reductase family protein [Streptacidiphilus jiangxiensis]|uniref:NADH-FMN oxidoreductase RutF, flavin reductase (DIM6/NTAB) family n=1 Tax=Streptacidiphilus jiangxiensis TaxID=235985 RepID=A0A1H7VL26_STRJI|nr:flavin reductase family protein [Streptacidiphilus jiangxiensis]SEM09714.1 NADH-FMN oxidoreductase RutF, flavin reductase (DIM6/NTAB) family [Streptacidiphilus jiangxiensis]
MPVSSERFREIFGSLPTAVAVVTAIDENGSPRGFTCNAFCAVSAEPPLLMISVGKASNTLPALQTSRAFVVNFLSSEGVDASQIFAGKGQDKFTRTRWEPSAVAEGAPVLTEVALAYAECRTEQTVEAGDHLLIIGRVDGGTVFARDPLLYRKGSYHFLPQPAAL